MSTKLIDRNVVIVAKEFNLTLINHVWLFKKEIFTEEELRGCHSMPMIVEAKSKDFNFHLVPDRLQFSVSPQCGQAKNLLKSKVGKIITELPHTPYTAAGINLKYLFEYNQSDFRGYTKSLFCPEDSNLCATFDSPDSRYGAFFSKNIIDTRLRLDIKPIASEKGDEQLQLNYNFHLNIDGDHEKILNLLEKWEEAESIVENINKQIEPDTTER